MSVDLWIFGNHSISFKGRKIENSSSVIDLLNSLEFEKSEFLIERCKDYFTPDAEYYKSNFGEEYYDNYAKKRKEILERFLKKQSWSVYEDAETGYDSEEYEFEGPCGLRVKINKYFTMISIWVWRYSFWWSYSSENFDFQKREKWRFIISQITNILGGDYVMYFPDNMSDLDVYLPTNYFPKELNKKSQEDVRDLEQLVKIISEKYSKPLGLLEADQLFNELEIDPFVIDRFEDLDKTIKI